MNIKDEVQGKRYRVRLWTREFNADGNPRSPDETEIFVDACELRRFLSRCPFENYEEVIVNTQKQYWS